MRSRDLVEMLVLAAIWGGSFLFMRVGAPEFGPLPLAAMRVLVGALCLIPFVLRGGAWREAARRPGKFLVVGVLSSALPFCLFSYAALSLPTGASAILNATTPLWGALVGVLFFGERLSALRWLGLAVGFAGVVILVAERAGVRVEGSTLAAFAVLLATCCYGIAAHLTKRWLAGVPAMVVAAGSQTGAALALLPFLVLRWPAVMPSAVAWGSALSLGIFCTGVAYALYFRLIAHTGPMKAMSVTYLIPIFGMLWGALFLHDPITHAMIAAALVILLGTALTAGMLRPRAAAGA